MSDGAGKWLARYLRSGSAVSPSFSSSSCAQTQIQLKELSIVVQYLGQN